MAPRWPRWGPAGTPRQPSRKPAASEPPAQRSCVWRVRPAPRQSWATPNTARAPCTPFLLHATLNPLSSSFCRGSKPPFVVEMRQCRQRGAGQRQRDGPRSCGGRFWEPGRVRGRRWRGSRVDVDADDHPCRGYLAGFSMMLFVCVDCMCGSGLGILHGPVAINTCNKSLP